MTPDGPAVLDLVDYRRRVAELYQQVRARGGGAATWRYWTSERDRLFASHPQSAVPLASRDRFDGLAYFAHDRDLRTTARFEAVEGPVLELAHSASGTSRVREVGRVHFELVGRPCSLSVYWFDQYGGGLFLPFRDETSGQETYGGGRYLLDTAKGADLGRTDDGSLVLDLNYAYHPSCFHDPRWSCPLAPPQNRLPLAVRAGERTRPE